MKTLYFDCGMGAAGDMICASLLQLHPEPEKIIEKIMSLGLPGVQVYAEKASKSGISGLQFNVSVFGKDEAECCHDHGTKLSDIVRIIESSELPEKVRQDAAAVYGLIAEAESKVHGTELEKLHFHEVGMLDGVTDVLTACLLIHELKPERICASAVHVGSGTVKCAHGVLPVPAPATALILCGIPTYAGDIKGELCTPTGAALLKYFVNSFEPQPLMRVEKIGCGLGHRDFEQVNVLRAFWGDAEDTAAELKCNVDDMTGEEIGYAVEALMKAGALDVSWQCVGMKKNRPGFVITVICRESDREKMLEEIFRHTNTIGVREALCRRYVLKRENRLLHTSYGAVSCKVSRGYGAEKEKAEFEDLKRIAEENNFPLSEVKKLLELDE